MLDISNYDFEITRAITPWIVLDSVQLLLLIVLVISIRPRVSRSPILTLLARLLTELYSTRSNYYY